MCGLGDAVEWRRVIEAAGKSLVHGLLRHPRLHARRVHRYGDNRAPPDALAALPLPFHVSPVDLLSQPA